MGIKADTIFYNGKIYSMDSSSHVFSAMAVKNGTILALSEKENESILMDDYSQEGHTVLKDLNNGIVLPGLSDTHVHAPGLAYDMLFNVNLYQALSKDETLDLIRNHVNEHPQDEIYYGRGVNSGYFEGVEMTVGPRKEHLDRISSDKPIIIADFGGNYLWMNSAAFDTYGITQKTECPQGGEIPLDPKDQSLWGIVRGEARTLVPYQSFSEEQNYLAAKWFQNQMLAYGYTSVFSLRPPGTVRPRTTHFPLFEALEKRGELFLRVQGGRDMDPNGDVDVQIEIMEEERDKHNSGQIRFTTAKFFLDGSIEGLDAYLLMPYESASGKDEDYKGIFLWEEGKLADAFRKCMEAGFQIHCHAIGDGAVNRALNALEQAKQQLAEGDYRTVFTHLQLVSPTDVKRMKKHHIIANVQTYWHLKSPVLYHQIEKPLLGDRAEREYPLQSLIAEGIVVTASSDYPVTPDPNPFYAIEAGVTRNLCNAAAFGIKDIADIEEPTYLLNKEERTSVGDMIKAFTANAAYSIFQENLTGSLEPGKAADFIEISADPFTINPTEIEFIKVRKTYFGGRLVYSAETAV